MTDQEKVWRPNSKKQEDFLALPDSIEEALYGGAAGGGKTEILLMLPLLKKFHELPWFTGIIFRRTYAQLERSLIPRSKTGGKFMHKGKEVRTPSYYDFQGDYNEQKHTWTFPSGAKIIFGHLDTDTRIAEYDTDQYNYMGWEELTDFSEKQYTYLSHRCRGKIHIIRAAATPGNVGNSWVRKRFVEEAPGGYKLMRDKVTKTARIFIPAKLPDNKDLMNEDPGYLDRLRLLPLAEQRAKIEGDWWAFEGQVFPEFRSVRFLDEPNEAIHVVEPFPIPEWWPKLLSIDWGFAHHTSAHWAAVSPDNRIYVYREYFQRKTKVSTWAADMRRFSQFDGNIASIVIDPSAEQDRGLEKTIKQQFIESSGFDDVELADNDRIGGKMLVHDFLRWTPRPNRYIPQEGYNTETGMRILRMHGEEQYHEYLNLFKPEPPETNLPRLQIFRTCPALIDCIPQCVYDETHPEDIKKWDGDDPIDDLKYLLKAADRYLNDAKYEHERRSQLQLIINRKEASNDQTTFYRQMEVLEKKYNSHVGSPAPVRRKAQIARPNFLKVG